MAEVWTPPALDDISTSELVTAAYLNGLGNSLRFLKEVEYEQFTADVTVTATTEGTANSVVSASTLTYEAVPHMITFFCPGARPDNGAAGRVLHVILYDSTTALGELAGPTTPAAANDNHPIHAQFRITPTAASHTYNVKAWTSAGTALIQAGAGGTGTKVPGFIRVERIPT